ncbi:MAG: ComEC/Rec2-related protein [Pedosphaera sp.]|nr:ComEC/Rec2-related protein [Pedosphaera sp.]
MKRPLVFVTLLYVAGILLARWMPPLPLLFGAAFALLLPALCWTRARPVLLCLLCVLAGWINLAQRVAILSPNDLRNLVSPAGNIVTVRGRLLETPQRRSHIKDGRLIESTLAQLEVTDLSFEGHPWQPAAGRIVTTTRGLLPEKFFKAQTVVINGVLDPPTPPVAEGLFDYPAYLEHLGIYYSLSVESPPAWKIISSPAQPPLADRFCAWSRSALARGLPVEDETLQLEWALTLGWKPALTEQVSEPFVRAATYHIFAVDGLRIAIIAAILMHLLRVSGVPRVWCGIVTIPFILFYAALTGWPASAIRAIVMVIVVFVGWALKRPSDLINSLFAAAIIILVWEPRELFQAGFQLSFFVVFCIVLIRPAFDKLGKMIFRAEPFLPDELRPRWQKVLRTPTLWLLDLFLASVAAWLGSIPLVAYYFHLVTPLSGPANVLAIPLCILVLIANLSSLLLAGWFPFASEIFNHAGWAMMKSIQATSHWSANWPGAYFYLPMPSLFTLALYYLILLTVLTGWLFREKWRKCKIISLSLLILVWCVQWLAQRPVTQLTFLPLYGGHAIHVQSPGARNEWLIDCGNESSVDTVVKPFLRAQGVNRLPHFILTHGAASYTDGASLVCELFAPRSIFTSPINFRSPAYKDFQALLKTNQFRAELKNSLQSGDQFGPWTVLHPNATNNFPRGEDNALILRAEINGTRILLLSSLGQPGQRALLDHTNNNLRADIVVAGIPDVSEPLGDNLLNAIQPRVIIIADSAQPAPKRASARLRARLEQRKIPVIYESLARAVTLEVRPGRWDLRAMDGTRLSSAPSTPTP